MRKITSMTVLLSFVVLVFNSVVLYIAPEGRVAYWADWHFLGLTKSQWGDQHTTVGFLFLAAGVLHIFYNWKPILSYMKNKAREIKIVTWSFNVALLLTAFFVIGTYYAFPPMNAILHISDSFKDAGAKKYGEPPYGHAELSSLDMFAKKENLDRNKAIALLKAAGITSIEGRETLKEIARRYHLTPQQVYNIIKSAKRDAEAIHGAKRAGALPDSPPSGFGRKTLREFCNEYNLDLDTIIGGLASRGIKAEGGQSMKENAGANGKEPLELFEILSTIANKPGK